MDSLEQVSVKGKAEDLGYYGIPRGSSLSRGQGFGLKVQALFQHLGF